MSSVEAILLGLLQGFTEFLPVSSSGHLQITAKLFDIKEADLFFTVLLHVATVFSTITVFRKEILSLLSNVFNFKSDEFNYILKIIISMIPVAIVGLFFKDYVEGLFEQNMVIVGICLIITAILLILTMIIKDNSNNITYGRAFIIGISQSIAVLPGLSRSGATISTALLIGINKEEATKFSFLMVLVPVIGEGFLNVSQGLSGQIVFNEWAPYIMGFVSAYVSGFIACKLMINIVKRQKLYWFAIYCFLLGIISILFIS